ncbi:hypothetical protein K443DRAFT_134858 [Laccaria amethystina LaAM-08-1]|uniref:ferric-chelate reductase (NADPH) n=1 Tax=Laccaria amethystina LaAM-08-1 TaxID=1095629 RepID=A0A0C9WJ52_9AGAR|nr:hypothetical protein K443DRAFT_134858 [Laccaria amethystina LaAM-08-1]
MTPPSTQPSGYDDRLAKKQIQFEHIKDLWIFLASLLAFLTVIRILRLLLRLFILSRRVNYVEPLEPEKHDVESTTSTIKTRVNSPIYRLQSAIATTFRIVAFRWSIPIGPGSFASISELTFIFGYMAAMFLWLFLDTRNLKATFYQARAAHLASCQLPLIIALAGKNNLISWMTGIGHEKLNILHRASARTNFIFLWIHTITRTLSGISGRTSFRHNWMRAGAVGMAALTLMNILSLRPVRNMAFEFFLICHIVLVLIFLFASYYHAQIALAGSYIWPALFVWGLDRFIRLVRVIWNNSTFRRKGDPSQSLATVKLLSEDTIIMSLKRQDFSWAPGQHAYVILPTVSKLPFEAHPFTMASISEKLDGTFSKGQARDVVFFVKGCNGFTKRLRDHGVGTVPAYVDGPYGCPPDLCEYATCILVAGGSGISYTLSLFLNLIRENARGKSAVRRILFVWAFRDESYLSWLSKTMTEALSHAKCSLSIELRMYLTAPSTKTSSSNASIASEKDGHSAVKTTTVVSPTEYHPSLKLVHGRPNIHRVLHDEIAACTNGGSISVDDGELMIAPDSCWTSGFDGSRATCPLLRCRCTSSCVKRTPVRHSSR